MAQTTKTLSSLAKEGKVSPEALQVMFLDEMCGRLRDTEQRLLEMSDQLTKMQEQMQQSGKGISDSFTIAVTDEEYLLPMTSEALSALIINDGPASVFHALNKSAYGDAPLNASESIAVDLHKPAIKQLKFQCRTGLTASVRVFVTQ